jgi:hypothetical protein
VTDQSHAASGRNIHRGDDFDRVEILGRLRIVERGERTALERELQIEVRRLERQATYAKASEGMSRLRLLLSLMGARR